MAKLNASFEIRDFREKSLHDLEGATWADPDYPSPMAQRIRALSSVPIGKLTDDDLRLVIGQRRGLRYLVPLALERLATDPLIDASMYPGDLLEAVVRVPDEFWQPHVHLREQVSTLLDRASVTLPSLDEADRPLVRAIIAESSDRFA